LAAKSSASRVPIVLRRCQCRVKNVVRELCLQGLPVPIGGPLGLPPLPLLALRGLSPGQLSLPRFLLVEQPGSLHPGGGEAAPRTGWEGTGSRGYEAGREEEGGLRRTMSLEASEQIPRLHPPLAGMLVPRIRSRPVLLPPDPDLPRILPRGAELLAPPPRGDVRRQPGPPGGAS
jgi:hypothetical protein